MKQGKLKTNKRLQVIYVPGLGDRYNGRGQHQLTRLWRLYGLRMHYFAVGWDDNEVFDMKLKRLLKLINDLAQNGKVALVGTSAGASLAVNAYAARNERINGVVLLFGKINNPQTIAASRYRQNPAFRVSLNQLPQSLRRLSSAQKMRILSIKPLADGLVPPGDTVIEGATSKTIPVIGHSAGIILALIFGGLGISRFLKRQSN